MSSFAPRAELTGPTVCRTPTVARLAAPALGEKRVAIIQSCYIPWKGFFDIVNAVDEFILLDDVQYSRGEFRNRNRIKTASGARWLTIPTRTSGRFGQRIDHVEVVDQRWRRKHLTTIENSYARAPHFSAYRPWLRELYLTDVGPRLSEINRFFIDRLCDVLRITTPVRWSSEFPLSIQDSTDKSERVIALCHAAGASHYISGPKAKAYIDEDRFAVAGIRLSYVDYGHYAPYAQVHPAVRRLRFGDRCPSESRPRGSATPRVEPRGPNH